MRSLFVLFLRLSSSCEEGALSRVPLKLRQDYGRRLAQLAFLRSPLAESPKNHSPVVVHAPLVFRL